MTHPELVHFPIAFAFLALLFSVIALFTRSKGFNIAFLILTIAMAFGASVAALAGQDAAAAAKEQLGAGIVPYIEQHSEWASFAIVMAWVSALLCLIQFLCSFAAGRKGYTIFSILTLISLIVTCFAVYETAKRGGALVYQHGAGVENSYTPPPQGRYRSNRNAAPSTTPPPSQSQKSTRSYSSTTTEPETSPSSRTSTPYSSSSASDESTSTPASRSSTSTNTPPSNESSSPASRSATAPSSSSSSSSSGTPASRSSS